MKQRFDINMSFPFILMHKILHRLQDFTNWFLQLAFQFSGAIRMTSIENMLLYGQKKMLLDCQQECY